jgi:hypothetical protein
MKCEVDTIKRTPPTDKNPEEVDLTEGILLRLETY